VYFLVSTSQFFSFFRKIRISKNISNFQKDSKIFKKLKFQKIQVSKKIKILKKTTQIFK